MPPKPLTQRQAALVERMRAPGGGSRLLITYFSPGAEHRSARCFIEQPYSTEDGRTVGSLIDRGILRSEGDGMWTLGEAFRQPPEVADA